MRIPSNTPDNGVPGVVPVRGDQQPRKQPTPQAADADVTLSASLRAHIEQANRSAATSSVAAMGTAEGSMMTADQAASAVQAVASQPPAAATAAHAGLNAGRVLGLLRD
jgi:hypothetical protein